MTGSITVYLKPRILAFICLGLTSGLPLALTASTLGIWLSEAKVDKATIGIFAAVATPYTLKFLWAPLIDQIRIPFLSKLLGRRRSWILVTHIATVISLVLLGSVNPAEEAFYTGMLALIVAFCSASVDIVVDAYRVEMFESKEQGAGIATFTLGYRLGMLASSAGALFMAEYMGWAMTYYALALIMPIGILASIFMGEPRTQIDSREKQTWVEWFNNGVIAPFKDFMTHNNWVVILLFVMFFKLGDALAGVMTGPFLIELGFSKPEIATIVKTYGLIATLAGSFIAGIMVHRIGIMNSLWISGALQMFSNLIFCVQAYKGHDPAFLLITISIENFCSGLGSVAFVAYLSSLCNVAFTATQYALLSSLAAVGRTWFSTISGFASTALGWVGFFVFTTIAAMPGLFFLFFLVKFLKKEQASLTSS